MVYDDHILVSVSKSPKRTIENITGNIALVRRIANSRKVALLTHLSNSPVPDKETRKFGRTVAKCVYGNGYDFKTWSCNPNYESAVQTKATSNSNEEFFR